MFSSTQEMDMDPRESLVEMHGGAEGLQKKALEMLMEANWGVEEGRNVCDDCIVVHTVLRNSLQMLL